MTSDGKTLSMREEVEALLEHECRLRSEYEKILDSCIDEGVEGAIRFRWEQKRDHIEALKDILNGI